MPSDYQTCRASKNWDYSSQKWSLLMFVTRCYSYSILSKQRKYELVALNLKSIKLILIKFEKMFSHKWIYFTILTFAIIEEMASGQQLLRQIVLTYARIIYILVCTRLALPWGLFAIFAHHHYYVDYVPSTFFTVGWHSLVTTNSQTKLMPFLAPVGET